MSTVEHCPTVYNCSFYFSSKELPKTMKLKGFLSPYLTSQLLITLLEVKCVKTVCTNLRVKIQVKLDENALHRSRCFQQLCFTPHLTNTTLV